MGRTCPQIGPNGGVECGGVSSPFRPPSHGVLRRAPSRREARWWRRRELKPFPDLRNCSGRRVFDRVNKGRSPVLSATSIPRGSEGFRRILVRNCAEKGGGYRSFADGEPLFCSAPVCHLRYASSFRVGRSPIASVGGLPTIRWGGIHAIGLTVFLDDGILSS